MNYHDITKEDMKNGDGLRTVLWVAGCEHHCPGCQNPVTWNKDGGIPFDEKAREELMQSLEPDYISGITFSGGDPLAPYNLSEVLALIKEISVRFGKKKTVWIYTGYTLSQLLEDSITNPILKEILCNTDTLVDGEYKQDLRDVSLRWRGSSNQRVIDIRQSLEIGEAILHCK